MDDPHNKVPAWDGTFKPLDVGVTPTDWMAAPIFENQGEPDSIVRPPDQPPPDPWGEEMRRRVEREAEKLKEEINAPIYDALRQGLEAGQKPFGVNRLDNRIWEEQDPRQGLTLPQLCNRMNAEEAGTCTIGELKPADGTPAPAEQRRR